MIIKVIPKGSTALTPDGSEFATVGGPEHAKLKIERRLKFYLGEWFADLRLGIPYFQHILGQKGALQVARAIFWEAIEETPGVASVKSVRVRLEPTRELFVDWEAVLESGEVVSDSPFIVRQYG